MSEDAHVCQASYQAVSFTKVDVPAIVDGVISTRKQNFNPIHKHYMGHFRLVEACPQMSQYTVSI